eukprot:scaffold13283_cov71-Skeletonema_marinoi.AAC.10
MSRPSKQQFRLHAIVAWVSHFRAQQHHSPQQRSMQEQSLNSSSTEYNHFISQLMTISILIPFTLLIIITFIRLPPQLIHPFQHINRNSINQQLLHQIVYNP